MGERFTIASGPGHGQWAVLARALEPCRTHPPSLFPGPPNSPASPRPGELEGPGEKARICLSSHFPPEDHHSTTLAQCPSNNSSLTVACLGAGPTEAPTNDRMCPLMVTTDSGLLGRRVHCGTNQWLDGAHCGADQWLSRTSNAAVTIPH